MTLKKARTKIFTAVIVYLSLCFIQLPGYAQQEIPENVKNLIVQGINALDSAKVPADVDKALYSFMEAVKTAPDYADAHFYLGKTLSMLQGNARNAIKEFKKYLELYPDAPDQAQVEKEITQLEEIIMTGRKSSLAGVELIELSDGIYVKRVINEHLGDMLMRLRGVYLYEGDKIVKVDNIDISGMSLQQVLNVIDSSTAEKLAVEARRVDRNLKIYLKKRSITGNVRELAEEDLHELISNSQTLLVVFWESASPETHQYEIDKYKLVTEYKDELQLITVNIDENKFIAEEFNIAREDLPTVTLYRGGRLIESISGYQSDRLSDLMETHMKIKH